MGQMIENGVGNNIDMTVTASDVKDIYQELTMLKHTGDMFKNLFAAEENAQKEKVIHSI